MNCVNSITSFRSIQSDCVIYAATRKFAVNKKSVVVRPFLYRVGDMAIRGQKMHLNTFWSAIVRKEPAISFYFANLEEILHRAHLRGNPIYTAWFLKFRGKYFFSTKVHNISVIRLYLNLFCTYNGINKKTKHIFQTTFFLNCLFQKLVLNKNVQSQHTNGNYLVWFWLFNDITLRQLYYTMLYCTILYVTMKVKGL